MLKKIEFYYDEDGEQTDISYEKIYWDTTINMFRHRFECCECGITLSCMCFKTLKSALSGAHDGMICTPCGIKEALRVVDSIDLMECHFEGERHQKSREYALSLIPVEEVRKYFEDGSIELKHIGYGDLQELIYNTEGAEAKLKAFVVSLMTEEEKREEFFESCDGSIEGEFCEM